MRWLCVALALLAVVGVSSRARATPASFTVGAAPGWIAPAAPSDDSDAADDGALKGRRYLLYDRQVRVGDVRRESYVHVIQRITNESGLDSGSQLNVTFDPSYETLTIHSVVVRRGPQVLDRLDRQAIRLVQRETNLDAQVYDGEVSAVQFLADLRVGDVVDYAYTIGGVDPTLEGHLAEAFVLGGPEPIGHLHARLLFPRARIITSASLGPGAVDVAPSIQAVGGDVEYVWDLSHVKAYKGEADAPASYDAYPWVEVSQFASWQEVAALGARLFDVPARKPGALEDWVKRAVAETGSADAFALRAIRFVQDEVRYVAIEVGISRRRPTDPHVVFDRRYGDCKDKTALLVALLRAGGIFARPALVSSTRGESLDAWAPSPEAFDHAIVAAKTATSEKVWIDPTATLQGGGLERFQFPGFERALVLDPQATRLTRLEPSLATEASPEVHDEFHVAMPGTTAETLLDSDRIYRGALADAMRVNFRGRTRQQLRDDYVKMYMDDFPAIHAVGELEISDDRDADVMRVVAHFAIPTLWSRSEGGSSYRVEIVARGIMRMLDRPSTESRTAPFSIPYPLLSRYEAVFDLPYDLTVNPEVKGVDGGVFRLSFASSYTPRQLRYVYELATSANVVGVGDLAAHVTAVDKARSMLVRALTYSAPLPDGPNWPFIVGTVVAVALLAWASIAVYRYNPAPKRRLPDETAPRSIGGWMILLAIAIVSSPIATLLATLPGARFIFSRASWGAITTPELATYRPAVAWVVVGEFFFQLVFVAYDVALVRMFFGARRSFPMHLSFSLLGAIVFEVADIACASAANGTEVKPQDPMNLLRTAIFAAVWLSYLARSRRAAARFVK